MPTITQERCVKHRMNHRNNDYSETTTSLAAGRYEPSIMTTVQMTRETDGLHIGIAQVLGMRVGCWQPPVYVRVNC